MRVILGGIGSAGAAVLILGYHRRKAKKIADLKGEVSRLGEEKRVLAAEVEKLSALAAESQKQKRPVKAASGVAMGSAPILEALSVTGKLSIEEAAVITGMPQSEIEFLHLEHLVEEGFAEDVWDGGRVMRITKPGRIALEKHRKDQEWLA